MQMGGSEAIIHALIRGLEKHGGRLLLKSHVDQIIVEGDRATGVMLRPKGSSGSNTPSTSSSTSNSSSSSKGDVIRARCGVVSNASVWDTQKLLPGGAGSHDWRQKSSSTPPVSGTWS